MQMQLGTGRDPPGPSATCQVQPGRHDVNETKGLAFSKLFTKNSTLRKLNSIFLSTFLIKKKIAVKFSKYFFRTFRQLCSVAAIFLFS